MSSFTDSNGIHHACNGITGTRSLGNPKSRLSRLRNLFRVVPEMTRDQMVTMLTGRKMSSSSLQGWGSSLFGPLVHNGYLVKTRRGRMFYYTAGPRMKSESPGHYA